MKQEGKRMMNRKNWTGWVIGMVAWLLLAGAALRADVKVTNIEVKPRYPWNGLVDIVYSINCTERDINGQEFEVRVEFEGYDAVLDKKIVMKTMTGDGVGAPIMSGGPYKATWDAAKDYPTINSSKFQIKIHASVPLYMVVDLSGGPDATRYPVRYTGEAPNLDDDTCRTTELWLRRIPAGKFLMGSPENELGHQANEILHEVTITKTYYIGIFELTQKQALLLSGNRWSKYSGRDICPVDELSYVNGNNYIFKTLKNKTGLSFDYPTEAEWEYACRAGTTTSLNSGENLNVLDENDENLNEVARNSANYADGKGGYNMSPTKVGCYKPNRWELYDMHGNVLEWVKDFYGDYSELATEDPCQVSGTNHVLRGGAWGGEYNGSYMQRKKNSIYRSAYRLSGSSFRDKYNNFDVGRWGEAVLGCRVFCCP